jgi:hypothetical protein
VREAGGRRGARVHLWRSPLNALSKLKRFLHNMEIICLTVGAVKDDGIRGKGRKFCQQIVNVVFVLLLG